MTERYNLHIEAGMGREGSYGTVEREGSSVTIKVDFTDTKNGRYCAKLMEARLKFETPPDPEDEESTELEPEEILAEVES